jgi:hypothetical protein
MARFFSLRSSTRTRTREVPAGSVVADEPARDCCESYAPGHQVHYIHQGQALRSPSLHARNVIVEGHRVIVVLDDGQQLDYHHHDPDRLSSVLSLFPASRMVYPKFHALRVGPYWFNCAPGEFAPCRPEVEVTRS